MALEPERPIEKLLRSCAKKRSDEAGAGFSLHPATRGMLQGEVARQFKKAETTRAPISSFLLRLGPRLAWAVCAVAALIVLGTLFSPSRERGGGEYTLAKGDADATKDALTVTLDREAANSVDTKTEQALALAPTAGSALETAAVPAPTAVPPSRESGTSASGRLSEPSLPSGAPPPGRRQLSDRLEESSNAKLAVATQDAPISSAEAVPEPRANSVVNGNLVADAGVAARGAVQMEEVAKKSADKTDLFAEAVAFKRVDLQASAAPEQQKSKASTSPSVLLSSFKVRGAGNKVQFIDSDGSIYEGQMQPFPVGAVRARVVNQTTGVTADNRFARSMKEAKTQAVLQAPPQAQTQIPGAYNFSVSGTNITLGKKVVFSGSLTGVTNLASFLAGRAASDGVQRFNFQPFPAARSYGVPLPGAASPLVSGRAIIDGGSEIQIQAVYSRAATP